MIDTETIDAMKRAICFWWNAHPGWSGHQHLVCLHEEGEFYTKETCEELLKKINASIPSWVRKLRKDVQEMSGLEFNLLEGKWSKATQRYARW